MSDLSANDSFSFPRTEEKYVPTTILWINFNDFTKLSDTISEKSKALAASWFCGGITISIIISAITAYTATHLVLGVLFGFLALLFYSKFNRYSKQYDKRMSMWRESFSRPS